MDFNPQQSHEQRGRRPKIVLSGVILCDQAKMLNINAQNAQFKEKCPIDLWNEAKELVINFL